MWMLIFKLSKHVLKSEQSSAIRGWIPSKKPGWRSGSPEEGDIDYSVM